MSKHEITLADNSTALLVYGDLNKNLVAIEEGTGVTSRCGAASSP